MIPVPGNSFDGFYTCPYCGKKMPDCYRTKWCKTSHPHKPHVDPWFNGAAKANFYKHVRKCQNAETK